MASQENTPVRPVVTGVFSISGERTMTAEELASRHDTSIAAVERSLGGRTLYVSDRSGLELGLLAAQRCLERTGAPPDSLDAIIWFGEHFARPGMYLEHHLRAMNANPVAVSFNCTELVTALAYARAMMRDDDEVRRVLLVGGVTWGGSIPNRTRAPIVEGAFETIFSDAGSAVLIERSGQGVELVSFGDGCVGSLWDYVERQAGPRPDDPRGPVPTILQALLYSKPAHDRALRSCLRRGDTRAQEIDHILFAREPGGIERTLMRTMSLDAKKLWDRPGGPTHNGISDQLLTLEQLLDGGAQSGARILIVARAMGLMRCALLRMTSGGNG